MNKSQALLNQDLRPINPAQPQVDFSLEPTPRHKILCFYINSTNRMQIIRITNIPEYYWERMILPGQHLIFEAMPEACLEIHSSEHITSILTDVIPCRQLHINALS
ncbi:MAG: DUF1830 domain-containing protein [Leptolyngbyaceae cyanobacterium MO_188.B28]|nr:DUF1830 domain-containing protein [Leptolyngbyaceae cyanobacterium MO_188.B28]